MDSDYRATKSGFARDVQMRIMEKYDAVEAAKKIPRDINNVKAEDFHNYLKDGLVLGYLIGCLKPNEASQRLGKAMWKEMGVGSASAFQTDQLYEMTNLPQVVICLSQLGVEAQAKPGYNGPEGYWMQRHTENRRTFTEEQLKAGESVIGLQMGYTGGANQSGINFGAHRRVTDMY
ncbi:Myophilin [Taenia crassiceps]|uniref:Myophilin n=1 Tax=Taenia crassiceps TaxID=6207 RepID=A0ABR4Q603_9CEST